MLASNESQNSESTHNYEGTAPLKF